MMQLYSPSGKKMFSEKFEHEYQSIDISKEMIILCDGSKAVSYTHLAEPVRLGVIIIKSGSREARMP